MPATGQEMGLSDFFNPEENIKAGIKYFKIQFNKFPEIPVYEEKEKFSLAAYNGGRGNVNRMIKLARDNQEDFTKWDISSRYLSDDLWPYPKIDFAQILTYVAKIITQYSLYRTYLSA